VNGSAGTRRLRLLVLGAAAIAALAAAGCGEKSEPDVHAPTTVATTTATTPAPGATTTTPGATTTPQNTPTAPVPKTTP
jgi:hypothetical protein